MPPIVAVGSNVFQTVEERLLTDMDELAAAQRALERFGIDKFAVALLLIRLFTRFDQTTPERFGTDMGEFIVAHNRPDRLAIEMDELFGDHNASDKFGTERLAVVLLLTRLFIKFDHKTVERFGTQIEELDDHTAVDKFGTERLAVMVVLTTLFIKFDQTAPLKLVTDMDELFAVQRAVDRFGTERLADDV